ncbi:MAG: 30S ribosome-binding factor RbfA, partial [Deltaproteobacteria bacterium]|nr:30S ribosome-binding factor RbfA [Deltaproteobacteria bacterium]
AEAEGRRVTRVAERIKEELARLLLREVGDPQLAWTTITGVEVSPDLRHARIFFVPRGEGNAAAMLRALDRAAPFLQRELGRSLRLRNTPRLSFKHDESFDAGARMDALISEVAEEKERQKSATTIAAAVAGAVNEAGNILVATHRNPDGDAIGSLLGMGAMLGLLGKRHCEYCPDGVPHVLKWLPGAADVTPSLAPEARFDVTILVDTADENMLPDGFPGPERRGILIAIDHHKQHGKLGDLVLRGEAAAVGEMLFELAREVGWPVDARVAECLYASIVSDTGSFRYSNTSPRTHRAAADLIAQGARPWRVATALYESYPLARQRLLSEVLRTLSLWSGGRYADMFVTPDTLASCGAVKADLDGVVNMGRAVEGVEISVLLRLEPNGDVKASFRSKGRIDVSEIAARFGGGGHRNAAACTLKGTNLEAARATVRAAALESLSFSAWDPDEDPSASDATE